MKMTNCEMCGSEKMEEKRKTMEHEMFGERITMKNVEYMKCTVCGEETFGENEKEITRMLREAYLAKETIVDFQEKIIRQ